MSSKLNLKQLKELVEEFKLDKSLDKHLHSPLFLNHTSPGFDAYSQNLIIIGEQHPGANINDMAYSRTNRTLVKLLEKLIEKHQVNNFFKEGISNLERHEKIAQLSMDELINFNLNPLEIMVNKADNLSIQKVESYKDFIKFAIISYLQSSLAKDSEREMQRIFDIISNDIDFKKIETINQVSQEIYAELELAQYNKAIIKKELSSENMEAGAGIKMTLYSCTQRSIIDKNTKKELASRILLALKTSLRERDRAIAQNFKTSFVEGDEASAFLVIGAMHIDNLKTLIEGEGIAVAVLSPFV